jgi:hypothetical protein
METVLGSTVAEGVRPGFFRRIAPAVGLFFLSPFVAEFLLGNISVSQFGAILFVAPMYGGGALLIREVTRGSGRGWPTMLVLALAYAVVEEGLVTQTLFNPSYFGLDLLRPAAVPVLGIGAWWTLFVLTLHVVWSMGASIALTEALVPARGSSPWLGRFGRTVAAALFVLGAAFNFFGTYSSEHFLASAVQLVSALAVVVVLALLAFRIGRRPGAALAGSAPSPWLVGLFALATSSIFMGLNLLAPRGWRTVACYLVLYALAIGAVTVWSRRTGWTAAHRLALAAGALLTYAWYGFPGTPVVGATGTTDLIGNTVFAAVALLLLGAAVARVRAFEARPHPAGTPQQATG